MVSGAEDGAAGSHGEEDKVPGEGPSSTPAICHLYSEEGGGGGRCRARSDHYHCGVE